MPVTHTTLDYDLEVSENGRVVLEVPFPSGSRIMVFVMERVSDTVDDLLSAAESTLDFWDNPFDDEDWNYA